MVTLYTMYSDDTPIYLPPDLQNSNHSPENVTPTSGNLTLEDNKSGTLTFSILPENLAYDKISLITSTIKIYEHIYDDDGTEVSSKIMWMGRPISIDEDMEHVRSYVCEGALAYLNDIICYPLDATIASEVVVPDEANGIVTATDMKNEAIKRALQTFLDTGGNTDKSNRESAAHYGTLFSESNISTIDFADCIYTVGQGYNAECPPNRKIKMGNITIANLGGLNGLVNASENDEVTYPSSNYPNGAWYFEVILSTPDIAFASALDQIMYATVETNGGHLVMRYEIEDDEEVMYLDYLSDYAPSNSIAEYGVNIIDYSGSIELNTPVTDIIPRGAVISTWTDDTMANDITGIDQTFNIGDTVSFKGTRHYVASTSDIGYVCTPGSARITNISEGTKHPYHLIHNDETSTVYGWVNETDVEPMGYNPVSVPSVEFTRRSYNNMPGTEYIGVKDEYGFSTGVHLVNNELVAKYGRIQQIVDFPDITDRYELKKAGEEWLRTHSSFLRQSYEVSMVDLGRLYGENMNPIHMLDLVHIVIPDYVNEYMPITKIDLDLTNPANTTFQFSKVDETSIASKSKQRKARVSASDSNLSVKINEPGDSLTVSMARNNKYLSKLDTHTDINTSVSRNNKNTFPGGKTGNFDLITSTWIDDDGVTHYETEKLTFVNGLLCSNNANSTGPEMNYFIDALLDGGQPTIIRPLRQSMVLRSAVLQSSRAEGNFMMRRYAIIDKDPDMWIDYKGIGVQPRLFGITNTIAPDADSFIKVNWYPYRRAFDTSLEYVDDTIKDKHTYTDLMLETDTSSSCYGLYYYMLDGIKQYWASPCIYFLPTTTAQYLYIFYARPLSPTADLDYLWSDGELIMNGPGLKYYSVYTQKIANCGYTTNNTGVSGDLESIYQSTCWGALENQLKKQALKYLPSNTYKPDMVRIRGSGNVYAPSPSPMTALLIIPYYASGQYNERGLYVSPAIVIPSKQYTYIGRDRYPNMLSIYTNSGYPNYHKIPVDYRRTDIHGQSRDWDSAQTEHTNVLMGDMSLDFKGYWDEEREALYTSYDEWPSGGAIKTKIDTMVCYVFTSQEDLDAIVEDYKKGELTQSQIHDKYRNKMLDINNHTKNMKLSYYFNGIRTTYYAEGSKTDPFGWF